MDRIRVKNYHRKVNGAEGRFIEMENGLFKVTLDDPKVAEIAGAGDDGYLLFEAEEIEQIS